MNPWIGVVVIGIGAGGTILMALLHQNGVAVFAGVIAVGVALVQATSHASDQKNLTAYKARFGALPPAPPK